MSLQVNFEYPAGSGVPTGQTEFNPGDNIGLLVKSGNILQEFTVTIVWSDKTLSDWVYQGSLSIMGNANIEIPLPDVATQGILVFQERGLFSSPSVSLGLGVGKTAPVISATKIPSWLIWGGIGLVVAVGGGLLVRKLINKN